MKLYRIICALLSFVLVLSLCACSGVNDGENLPPDGQVDLDNTSGTDNAADTSDTEDADTSFKVLTDPAIPSEEDIMRVFEHASSIWNQIEISSLDGIGGSEGVILDVTDSSNGAVYRSMQYYPVRDYETRADLEARFRECFSKELTEYKLEQMFLFQYREIDGRLHVAPADRGTNISVASSKVEYEVVDDTTISVTRFNYVHEIAVAEVDISYLYGICAQEMLLIYEDGRWVFDNFYVWDYVWDDGFVIIYDYARDLAATFLKAEALAAHFTGHASAYLGDGDSFEAVDENGFTQQYDHYGLANSLDELRSLLEAVFTPELADEFMNTTVSGLPLFTERDGKLYKFGGYVGLYAYDDLNREIISYTEGVGKIDVCVNMRKVNYDNTVHANQTYTAVIGEDGKYRFDGDFPLPIQIAVNMEQNG